MTHTRQFASVALALSLLAEIPACTGQSADASRTRQSADAAAAPVPHFVNFAGALKNHNGQPASGVVGITFLLYEEEEGGSPLWRETQNVTLDAEGRYSVALGAATPYGLPAELFAAKQARWLAIEPQGLPVAPRVMLLSVPYALKAGDAETIGGLPPSAFMLAGAPSKSNSADSQSSPSLASPETMSGSGITNFIPRWTPNSTTLGNSILYQSGTGNTAKVGVNTSAPAATLDVGGGLIARGSVQVLNRGTATAAKGWASQPLTFQASAFNSGTQKAVAPRFQWQAEAQANNTANPGGSLNLLYTTAVTPVETGLSIAGNGQIKFAPGQTFPGTGNGTVTGITAGTGLTGGGSTGNLTLNVDSTKVPLLSAANTFTGQITFAAGQTFPGTGTLTGITAGTGLTGGGTTGSPTLAVDATKVPLLSVPNTFTAPITFAGGQAFPGTVTSVTAGTGLSGGGSGGALTLNLNTTYSDGRYAQLSANNTYTGVQVMNNSVGIGVTSPAYPLHVMGTIRSENGLSLGGNAALSIDAPGIIGGHFTVLSNGRVGIDNSQPTSTLDVGGSLKLSSSATIGGNVTAGGNVNIGGTLQVNGDQPMSAAPHMYLNGYVPGPMAALTSEVPIISIPSKNILVTRMVATGVSTCPQAGALTFDLATHSTNLHTITLSSSPSTDAVDSGPLSIAIAAGTAFWGRVNPPNCGPFGSAPSQIAVSIEYVMQ